MSNISIQGWNGTLVQGWVGVLVVGVVILVLGGVVGYLISGRWQGTSKPNSPSLGGGSLVLLAMLLGMGLFGLGIFSNTQNISDTVSLPILIIGGVLLLIGVLAIVSLSFALFGLANKKYALGLPKGSMNAVIALSLIVIFAIFSIYLFVVLNGGAIAHNDNLTQDEETAFVSYLEKSYGPDAIVSKGKDSVHSTDTAPRYEVYYNEQATLVAIDFAKQLLILLGTLVASVSSFYFGASTSRTSTSPSSIASAIAPAPDIRKIQPGKMQVGQAGYFEITGSHLDTLREIKVVQGNEQIVASKILSNPSSATFHLDVPQAAPAGVWDVVVADTAGRIGKLPSGLTI